ncbi:phage/plasmid replication protein, II/X family [Photobacterium leiognathi]|uniref:phage/plasmid replication protein, II/X family n=1 Tax=Photobacterium leiognathi TaxID=553611 RepID=UPI00298202EF|nr:phage/plasmid replication protein, II/X family [Photobacterium leiognathi]
MLDMIKLSIPFLEEYTVTTSEVGTGSVRYVDFDACMERGITLESRAVFACGFDESTGKHEREVQGLRHPYEQLPTSFTGIAFKIFGGSEMRPACIELKASPAKIIQGHNLFGSDDLELGSIEMIMALQHAYPDFCEMLDFQHTMLDHLDGTYSCRVPNEFIARQVISQMKNVSSGHLRAALKNEHGTTCYFNKNSRHCDRKAYLKHDEYNSQLAKFRKLADKGDRHALHIVDVMANPHLINYSRNLVRFEAGFKRRYLDKFNIPQYLFDTIDPSGKSVKGAINFFRDYKNDVNENNLVQEMWTKAFKPLFDSFRGLEMDIFNDKEVRDLLRQNFNSVTKTGKISFAKADRLFRFYRSILSDGYLNVKDTYSKAAFNKSLADLSSVGIAKAQLQQIMGNSTDTSNVVPFVKVINLDFSNQFPADYVEPKVSPIAQAYSIGDFSSLSHMRVA